MDENSGVKQFAEYEGTKFVAATSLSGKINPHGRIWAITENNLAILCDVKQDGGGRYITLVSATAEADELVQIYVKEKEE